MTTKQELRTQFKSFDKSCYSDCIIENLIQTELYKKSKNIMIFYPLEKEVNLLELMKDTTKNFYLPKICDNNLLCCPYSNNDKLEQSKFKTKEPITKPCDNSIIDLVIVPALLCDKNNFRLGYGGGFYDRFLKNYSGKKICCIPKCLIIDTICPEPYDVKMDLVITD
jgi:5-formyltetrahydrofolate cyclo-ligase